jgi:type IV pilus assembly protein PilB
MNPKAGLTYAKGLRAILRQDPDIIMVGEIRDLETAQIAVRSALTGHLVFSTLHTNNAPAAFTRLIDMGIEPFLVSCSLIGVLAQRLVRRICGNCKEEFEPPEEIIQRLNLADKIDSNTKFYRGKGCPLCNKTGYKGRIAIFELLENTREIQRLALRKASADEIENAARAQGMKTLRDAAIRKLLQGMTTFEEVFRVTQEEEM